MRTHTVEVAAVSNAAPAEVWRLLADVRTWPDWSRFDEAELDQPGDADPNGLGAVRRLRVGRLRSRETVLRFDPPRAFGYDYEGSLPLKDYRADVTLTGYKGGTGIVWHAVFRTKIPFTGWLLRIMLRRVLDDLATALATAAAAADTLSAGADARPDHVSDDAAAQAEKRTQRRYSGNSSDQMSMR